MLEVNKIYNGDCLGVLKTFPDNSIDSCVTDPPYGISFMNKHWDYQIPSVQIWEQVLRVLKPGGHLLCACGTRTQHRMVCNIEDAGFEIRDVISWIYASGFPKSLNVNKNLDGKVCECKKEISRQQEAKHDLRSMWKSDISKEINFDDKQGEVLQSGLQEQGSHSTMQGANANKGNEDGKESSMEGRGNDVQKEGELQEHKIYQSDRLDNSDGKERRVHNGTQIDNGENVPEIIDTDRSGASCRPQPNKQQQGEFGTIPNELNTQENGTWETCNRCGKPILPDGIGTALKPATEFWTLARKPISENTIAENVLKHGTGGLNIDGSRIELQDGDDARLGGKGTWSSDKMAKNVYEGGYEGKEVGSSPLGRFPANVIFDEFTGNILDEQSGELTSGYMAAGTPRKNSECEGRNTYGEMKPDLSKEDTYADSGGASRYFLNVKSGELCGFFTYFYTLINTEISCGNTLENQKVVGFVNGVTLEIEKFTLSEGLFTDGKKLTESCQPDTKFTIEILIKLMTELKTCNLLRGMNIEWYTQEQTKSINSLMELKIGGASVVKNISRLLNLHLEMLEHIRDIVNRVQAKSYENGEVQIENDTTNIIENTGRFIYTPKADNFERNKGLKDFPAIQVAYGNQQTAQLKRGEQLTPNAGVGDSGVITPSKNHHPCVKPIDLMRYLVKLITHKHGICIDPFCGSGTTLIGCKLELIKYIGIDTNEEYCKIAEARVAAWNPQKYIEQTLF